MNELLKRVYDLGIIPVVAIDDAEKAVPLAKALEKGGLPAAEITFRTDAAEEAIRRIAQECPNVLIGAGTVLTKEQADRAIAAGAQFIVSPGFNPEMVKYVLSKGCPMLPGTATPGEMEQAMSMGLNAVKFFPAEQNGGIAKIKAVAGPYKTLRWMPTGGVTTKNLNDYLSFNQILACGGTWIAKGDVIEGEKWDAIENNCREAVETMLGFSYDINTGAIKGNATVSEDEITVYTLSAPRAYAYLERMGVETEENLNLDSKGNIESFKLRKKVGDVTITIKQK